MNFDPQVFFDALTSEGFRTGALVAIALTAVSQLTAVVIGLILAVMRESSLRVLRGASWTSVWIFRAIPTLVQLLFFWNALPQLIPGLVRAEWYNPFVAAWLALSINEGAYMAEIVRGGLLSIDEGQRLAARALGMQPLSVYRKVILPQLIRVIIPPTANEFITMLKITSLASVVSLREIMTATQAQIATTFRFAEWYSAAALYYVVLVSIFMIGQAWLERRYVWLSQPIGDGRRLALFRGNTGAR
jgi:polar amino acid transport system permease protein